MNNSDMKVEIGATCEKCKVAMKKSKIARTPGKQVLCFAMVFAGMFAFGIINPIVGILIMALAIPVGYAKGWQCPSCKTKSHQVN